MSISPFQISPIIWSTQYIYKDYYPGAAVADKFLGYPVAARLVNSSLELSFDGHNWFKLNLLTPENKKDF